MPMKKLTFVFLFCLLLLSLLSSPVSAANYYPEVAEFKDNIAYDSSGNVLKDTWCYEVADGIPSTFYLLDSEGKVVQESETQPVEDTEERVNRIDEKMGWIEFKSEGLEEFSYTICISLVNESGDPYLIYLFKDNNYEANQSLPVGTYNVMSVQVENDYTGKYQFESPSTITVNESKTATLFTVKLKAQMETIEETETKQEETIQEETVEEQENTSVFSLNTILLIGVLIISGIAFAVYKWKNL